MKTPQEMGPRLEILPAVFKVAGLGKSRQEQCSGRGDSWLNAGCSSEVRNRAENQYGPVTC